MSTPPDCPACFGLREDGAGPYLCALHSAPPDMADGASELPPGCYWFEVGPGLIPLVTWDALGMRWSSGPRWERAEGAWAKFTEITGRTQAEDATMRAAVAHNVTLGVLIAAIQVFQCEDCRRLHSEDFMACEGCGSEASVGPLGSDDIIGPMRAAVGRVAELEAAALDGGIPGFMYGSASKQLHATIAELATERARADRLQLVADGRSRAIDTAIKQADELRTALSAMEGERDEARRAQVRGAFGSGDTAMVRGDSWIEGGTGKVYSDWQCAAVWWGMDEATRLYGEPKPSSPEGETDAK